MLRIASLTLLAITPGLLWADFLPPTVATVHGKDDCKYSTMSSKNRIIAEIVVATTLSESPI